MVVFQEQEKPLVRVLGPAKAFVKVLLALALSGAVSMAISQEAPDAQVTPPKVIRFNASWPGAVDKEALVVLDFTINLDGTASDISVADTGFHEKRFADAAIRGLRSARFSPRMVNGVPESGRERIPVRFSVGNQAKGVTEDFRLEVIKVAKLIDAKDFAGAHFQAQWMLAEKVNLLYEYAVLQGTLANTYARVGENHAALIAAREATARPTTEIIEFMPGAPIAKNSPGKYLLNKEFVEQLLELRMVLAVKLGLSIEALDAYSQLAGLREIPTGDPLARAAALMTQQVLSGQPLVANARLDERGQWEHRPYRHTIAIRNIQSGPLKEMQLACHGNSIEHQLKPDEAWTIPESMNACSLHFFGGPGTTFQIVETITQQGTAQQSANP